MPELFEFTPEELKNRFVDHWSVAEEYAAVIAQQFNVEIDLHVRKLYLAVISAYKDIERYKNFHLTDPLNQKSDAVKRTAYLAKWISRFKPLQVREVDAVGELSFEDIATDDATIVNELFAIYLASVHLSVDVKKDFVISDEKAQELAYEMLFRQLNEDAFMMIFQLMRDYVSGTKEIVVYY